jgi:hypothetical protein
MTNEGSFYSLHLNEQQRLRFLNKNIRKHRDVDVSAHYTCEVEDDVYEEVVKSQVQQGLMFGGDPPEKPQAKDMDIKWFIDSVTTDVASSEWKNITIQFQELTDEIEKISKKKEILIDGHGFKVIEIEGTDACN